VKAAAQLVHGLSSSELVIAVDQSRQPIFPIHPGFREEGANTFGRPVGVAVDPRGAVLVADDLSNTIWRVTRNGPPSASSLSD